MNVRPSFSLVLLLLLFSCQKDYYLDNLNAAQAEINRINEEKTRLQNQLSKVFVQNQTILSQNAQLNQQLIQLQIDLANTRIDLATAEELLNGYLHQLNLLSGISDGLYKRTKIKLVPTIASLDTIPYDEDDAVFTSHYQVVDSLITFWGVVRDRSTFNSLPYFQELNYRNNYYSTRTVINQQLINATEFQLVLDITRNRGEDDEVPLFADLILSPTESIPYKKTNGALLAEYRALGRGIFSDSIYAAIDLFNPYSHLDAFIKDATRHGVDISYLKHSDFELIWEPDDFDRAGGYAYKVCDSTKIGIGLRESDWNKEIVQDFNDYRLSLMWHEFGHDILGLEHLCQGGHILTGRHQDPQIIISDTECESEHINVWGLSYDNEDAYRNFQRATKDMFEGFFQKKFDCSSGKPGVIYY